MPGHTPDNPDLFAGVSERLAELVVRYYDDNLSGQEAAELRDGLMDNASARDLFVRWGLQIQTLTESLAPQYSETDEPITFDQLAEMEAKAQAELVQIDTGKRRQSVSAAKASHASPSLAMRDLRSASGYLFRHALRSRYTYGSAIAAVLLLALTLFNPFANNTPAPQGTADNSPQPKPAESAPPILRDQTVATLTAVHNATWAEGASAPGSLIPGSKLHPNQRLTLTAGFAEITTHRGAVAILEAPCVVELNNNDNALRLMSGKLVGICDTESSKGFLVRTSSADIVDLGTEFGVAIRDDQTTEVHVFSGQVEAFRPDQSLDTGRAGLVLNTGYAARFDRRSIEPRLAFAKPESFVRSVAPSTKDDRPAIYSRFHEPETSALSDTQIADGRGWDGPWRLYTDRGFADMQPHSEQPLSWGAQRYLRFTTSSSPDAPGSSNVSRRYGAAGGVDLTQPHVIRFSYRFDSVFDGESKQPNKVAIFDGLDRVFGSSGQNTWSLHAWPNGYAEKAVEAKQWFVYDGDGTADPTETDYSRLRSTGIDLIAGDTYLIQVTVYPAQSEWDLAIVHGQHHYDSREALGKPLRFRNAQPKVYGNLAFNSVVPQDDSPRTISIDEVSIKPLNAVKQGL